MHKITLNSGLDQLFYRVQGLKGTLNLVIFSMSTNQEGLYNQSTLLYQMLTTLSDDLESLKDFIEPHAPVNSFLEADNKCDLKAFILIGQKISQLLQILHYDIEQGQLVHEYSHKTPIDYDISSALLSGGNLLDAISNEYNNLITEAQSAA